MRREIEVGFAAIALLILASTNLYGRSDMWARYHRSEAPRLAASLLKDGLIARGVRVKNVKVSSTGMARAELELLADEGTQDRPASFSWKQRPEERRLAPNTYIEAFVDRAGAVKGVLITGTLRLCNAKGAGINCIFDASTWDVYRNAGSEIAPLLVAANTVLARGYNDFIVFDESGEAAVLSCPEWGGSWNDHPGGADASLVEEEDADAGVGLREARENAKLRLKAMLASKEGGKLLPALKTRDWIAPIDQDKEQNFTRRQMPVGSEDGVRGKERFALAEKYRKGLEIPKDLPKAIELYRDAASLGHVEAVHRLGVLHALGEGVVKSDGKCVEYYSRAAQGGLAEAQHDLAVRYALGKGVQRNETRAIELYFEAALQGYEPSIVILRERGLMKH